MVKPLKSGVISLTKCAREASINMLEEIERTEKNLKIDHSKLVSYIVSEYRDKYFKKNMKKIISMHRDSKKQIKNKLSGLSDEQLLALTKAIVKIEQEDDRHKGTNKLDV